MWRREILLSVSAYTLLFVIQESFVNQIHLPLGGFSLILLTALIWASISEPEIAAVTGFISGISLDLSPSTDGPFGHWALVMVISCFVISYLGYGDDAIHANPIGLILMTVIAVVTTLSLYVSIGFIFGMVLGSELHLARNIFGIGLWSALIAPIIVPFISRIHANIYSGSR